MIDGRGTEKAIKRDGLGLLRIENAAGVTFGVVTQLGDGVLVFSSVGGVEVIDGLGLVCSEELDSQTAVWAGGWGSRSRRVGVTSNSFVVVAEIVDSVVPLSSGQRVEMIGASGTI